jgi:hypothetical protein
MRKLHISLGLALLLLLAQQGAVLHEVSHISRVVADSAPRVHAALDFGKACDLCVAFSQVANPAGNSVAVTQFAPSSCGAYSIPASAVTPSDVPAPRNRGPPLSTLMV